MINPLSSNDGDSRLTVVLRIGMRSVRILAASMGILTTMISIDNSHNTSSEMTKKQLHKKRES